MREGFRGTEKALLATYITTTVGEDELSLLQAGDIVKPDCGGYYLSYFSNIGRTAAHSRRAMSSR